MSAVAKSRGKHEKARVELEVSYKTQRDAVETKVKEKRNALVKEEQDLVKEKGKLGGEVARKRKRLDQDKLIDPVEGEYAQKRRKGV
jgi:hypothetical protein